VKTRTILILSLLATFATLTIYYFSGCASRAIESAATKPESAQVGKLVEAPAKLEQEKQNKIIAILPSSGTKPQPTPVPKEEASKPQTYPGSVRINTPVSTFEEKQPIKDRLSYNDGHTAFVRNKNMGGYGGVDGPGVGYGVAGGRGGAGGGRSGVLLYKTYDGDFSKIPVLGDTKSKFIAELSTIRADEVWVIVKPKPVVIRYERGFPGMGCLITRQAEKEIALPLKHTDVNAQVAGFIATVEVTQQFTNPYDTKIEAEYVFPLPENAAVNDFIMIIGDRKIRGIIRERKEAEKIYQEARQQGYVASLLTQERPNIFTQKVANIEPGKQIDVNIKYFNTLAYDDGWYEFVFPMVVGPRFNPPGFTEGVGAVAAGQRGISGQKTEVQYLKPYEKSAHNISLSVDIDAGVAVEEVVSKNHVIHKKQISPERFVAKISENDDLPNKDFVLRFKVAGDKIKQALITHKDERGGFFTLMLYPPEETRQVKRSPMEMFFVIDTSGSMQGKPVEKAKDAVIRALRKLDRDDTFQVIRYANDVSKFAPKPVAATKENIENAINYVQSLAGSGGTMMIKGVTEALDFTHDQERYRYICFMTDGYIGNENQVFEAVYDKLGGSRIFSFGVGSSVNRFLLNGLAKMGKGAVAYVGLDEDCGPVIDSYYDRITHPALTDVKIDFGAMQVSDIYPNSVPDLFVGRPVIITGRYAGTADTTIRITGNSEGKAKEYELFVDGEISSSHPAIASVWARRKIEELADLRVSETSSELAGQILQTALEYNLMSDYTAFVAVDSSRKTDGEFGVTVNVPVPVPSGVKYETTVQER
jgi:Ca-activated chloride channel family protein